MKDDSKPAEQGVLGSILRDNGVIPDVLAEVGPDDFRDGPHRDIFSAAAALWESGSPVDIVTLANALHKRQQIANIGGYAYLAHLWDAIPTAASAVYYACIVREKAVFRRLAAAAAEIQAEALAPTGPAEHALETAEQKVFAISQIGLKGTALPLGPGLDDCLERLDARFERRASAGAVLTGFLDLDELMCGLQPAELIVLAARPSLGKTALALAIATKATEAGHPVFFASLEQPRIDLAERLICNASGVDGYRLRSGKIDDDDREKIIEAVRTLRTLPLVIDDAPGQSVLRIAANVRRLRAKRGVDLAIVDYLQLIEADDRKASRQEQVASASRRLKHLAREANIPLLCLAQLNREVESRADQRPKLADLRDSGEIEQNADTVLLLHKPTNSEGIVEVIMAKQRNGPIGTRTLSFQDRFMRFENFAVASPYGQQRNGYHSEIPL